MPFTCIHYTYKYNKTTKLKLNTSQLESKLPVVTFCHSVGGWVGIGLPIGLKTTVDTHSLSFPNDLS